MSGASRSHRPSARAVPPAGADRVASAAWARHDGAGPPSVSVVVATYGRSGYLAELVAALEAQDHPRTDFEVVITDNGSADDTWAQLRRLAAGTSLALLGLRLETNRGPGGARNHGAAHARGRVLAITDDDCLPTPGWVAAVAEAFADEGLDVAQGRVEPPPEQLAEAEPWDHTIWVTRPSPFFETCNVAYRRSAFLAVGGFDEEDELLSPRSGRAFGEDAVLAWQVQRHGGATFVPSAVVHHRCVRGSFTAHVRDVRHAVGFPGLARRSPLVAGWLRGGVFLSGDSAGFVAALGGLALTGATRRPAWLVTLAPWLWFRGHRAWRRTRGSPHRAALMLAQYAVVDATILGSLLKGSIRHRRLVL